MSAVPVVGRFAPTPSGRLHLGNIACAMLAWVSAKAQGGKCLLRIEDIDLPRERLRRSIIPAQHIRRRYTILDLGVRTRLLDRWTDAVFGQNGLWEIT